VSDNRAVIIKGSARFVLEGKAAADIIAGYRHCLTHEGRGEVDAALYLWGVIGGMAYQNAVYLNRTLAEIEGRRKPKVEDAEIKR